MARRAQPLTANIEIDGARQTLRKFRDLPKEASDAIKDRAEPLADTMASRARSAAKARPQSGLLAPTVKVKRDRLPVVQAGGAKRVGRNRAPAYGLLFASEFGMSGRSGWYGRRRYRSSTGRQFRPHAGRQGYWFFPTVEDTSRDIAEAWQKAADDVIDEFSHGGDV